MTDTVRDRAAEMLILHELEWISAYDGWACGCDEKGLLHLPTYRDAISHQANALADAGLLAAETDEEAWEYGWTFSDGLIRVQPLVADIDRLAEPSHRRTVGPWVPVNPT